MGYPHLQVQHLSKAPCIPCSPPTLPGWPCPLTHTGIIQPHEPSGAAHHIPSNWPRSSCGETASENERPPRSPFLSDRCPPTPHPQTGLLGRCGRTTGVGSPSREASSRQSQEVHVGGEDLGKELGQRKPAGYQAPLGNRNPRLSAILPTSPSTQGRQP